MKCGNCGKEGHSSSTCKETRVPLEQRKCFECGRTGHVANKCPQRVHLLQDDDEDNDEEILMLDWETNEHEPNDMNALMMFDFDKLESLENTTANQNEIDTMEEENKNEPQACTKTFEEVFSAYESDQSKNFSTFFSDHSEDEDTIQSIPHEDEIDEESFAQVIDLIGKQNHTGCKDSEGCPCIDFQAMPTDALERLIAEIRAMSLS